LVPSLILILDAVDSRYQCSRPHRKIKSARCFPFSTTRHYTVDLDRFKQLLVLPGRNRSPSVMSLNTYVRYLNILSTHVTRQGRLLIRLGPIYTRIAYVSNITSIRLSEVLLVILDMFYLRRMIQKEQSQKKSDETT
jgi:hypothetical protein